MIPVIAEARFGTVPQVLLGSRRHRGLGPDPQTPEYNSRRHYNLAVSAIMGEGRYVNVRGAVAVRTWVLINVLPFNHGLFLFCSAIPTSLCERREHVKNRRIRTV